MRRVGYARHGYLRTSTLVAHDVPVSEISKSQRLHRRSRFFDAPATGYSCAGDGTFETSVTRPGAFLGEPTRQLLDENLLAQFPQDIADVLFRVTFRDQVDRRLLNQLMQAEIAAGWIGGVQPVRKGLPRLHHDC